MKTFIIIILCLLFIFIFSGFLKYKTISEPYVYVDKETGVNYLVYAAGYKGGICPRYNSHGSLFVTEVNDERIQ